MKSIFQRAMFSAVATALLCFAPVRAEIPRAEHPRPDFQRDAWLNLNGEWQFEIDAKADGEARGLMTGHDLSSKITVPFCPESKLSGVGVTDYMPHVWYRRTFQVPDAWKGQRVLLNFGAVDYRAKVWLNGTPIGEHAGGYVPFTFDVTDTVKSGDNELVLHVIDELRSGLQPGGKQTHGVSEGCVYTRTTGIWQTVWLEAAGTAYVREFSAVPDLDGGRVFLQASVSGPQKDTRVRVRAMAEGKQVAEEIVPAVWRNTMAMLKLERVVAWEPGKPFLYDLTIETMQGDKVVDCVHSYFGLRKISIEGNRFLINGKPVFQRLVLDQGFYPDGIYTAPTDEALRRDVELSMAAGFNGARLHQKVFEPRLLYWADRLGYLVWGEFPSWGIDLSKPAAMVAFVDEWREALRRDRNHPAIIGWCPLNETGTEEYIAWTERLLAATQTMDPTRPFLDSSGYTHFLGETDVYDAHDYEGDPLQFRNRYNLFSLTGENPFNNNPQNPRSRYRGQPYFVSEYGGIRVRTDRDTGEGWGYGGQSLDVPTFLKRYKGLTDAQLDNPNIFGFCYTQLTDIEQEQNGVYFYDRQPKYDPAQLHAINSRPAACETQPPRIRHLKWQTIVPTSEQTKQEWRYTTTAPGDRWSSPDFDDSSWQKGPGGFGTASTPGAIVGTEWTTNDIWIRRHFVVEKTIPALAGLRVHHDEDAQIFVNGTQVAELGGFVGGYSTFLNEELPKALRQGDNVIAIHCRQTAGGQFIDAGIDVAAESGVENR